MFRDGDKHLQGGDNLLYGGDNASFRRIIHEIVFQLLGRLYFKVIIRCGVLRRLDSLMAVDKVLYAGDKHVQGGDKQPHGGDNPTQDGDNQPHGGDKHTPDGDKSCQDW